MTPSAISKRDWFWAAILGTYLALDKMPYEHVWVAVFTIYAVAGVCWLGMFVTLPQKGQRNGSE